jgi:predicted lipoprotein with Yx(FWY)xxD motif
VRVTRLAASTVLAAVLVAGCGGHQTVAGRPSANADITLSVRSTPALGGFLVTDGWTLYTYPPDRQRHVTCTKVEQCQAAWPPLFVGAGRKVIAGPGVRQGLIGTVQGDGGHVVTYNHWPLYYYIGDHAAGAINGQDQGFNWFVIAADGEPTKTDLTSPSGAVQGRMMRPSR